MTSSRTRPSRMADKYPGEELAALRRLLADASVVHVGLVDEGRPVVIPVAAALIDGGADLLLHGSTGSRWLRLIADGVPVSVAITAVDGLVVARSAFESSMHYRSAVLFGSCSPLDESEKLRALDILTEALIPGRVSEVRRPRAKELAATLVLRLTVDEWSFKAADGWPEDPADDVATDTWAGVLPMSRTYRDALPAPDLPDGAVLPPSVRQLLDD